MIFSCLFNIENVTNCISYKYRIQGKYILKQNNIERGFFAEKTSKWDFIHVAYQ